MSMEFKARKNVSRSSKEAKTVPSHNPFEYFSSICGENDQLVINDGKITITLLRDILNIPRKNGLQQEPSFLITIRDERWKVQEEYSLTKSGGAFPISKLTGNRLVGIDSIDEFFSDKEKNHKIRYRSLLLEREYLQGNARKLAEYVRNHLELSKSK